MADHDRDPQRTDAPVRSDAERAAELEAFVYPEVMQLNALAMTHPEAPLGEILALIQAHPSAHDAILHAVQRLWGNQAALRVTIHAGPGPSVLAAGLGGSGIPGLPAAPPAAASTESPVEVDAEREGNGATISASAGPVTGSVTMGPHGVTGGGVEASGEVGPRTHATAEVSTAEGDEGRTVTGSGSVTHRVGDRVTVGGQGEVEGNTATGEVRASGGATVRIMTSDRTVLQAHGLVDTQGNLTGRLELNVFRDRVSELPLTDEGRQRVLGLYLQASGPVGGAGAQTGPTVEGGLVFRIPGT